ncbi:MAG: nucleoside phosphorylase [Deltaproteobacteria bacterium]|nr:nucleoside phosphorylase [Deltaproteobacteria bacterium]
MKGIVQPIVTPNTPRIGPLGVMGATRADLPALIAAMGMENRHRRSLYMSQLHVRDDGVFLSGPFMGAPYSVMILETLAAWGARQVIFLGWCGAISATITTGDILVPTLAWIDEGTSRAYSASPAASPSDALTLGVKSALQSSALPFHEGAIWTTDAIFRETPDKMAHFLNKGALAVEMELSALFTVSAFLGVALSAILVVSDDLSGLTWNPGFKDRRFKDTRHKLAAVIAEICGHNPYSASRTLPANND